MSGTAHPIGEPARQGESEPESCRVVGVAESLERLEDAVAPLSGDAFSAVE